MKILIVSKCPTHPTDAGNRWWILAQAKILQKLGHEVHFLYIEEKPLRGDVAPYIEAMEKTRKYWKNNFHLFTVSKWSKTKINFLKYYRILFCHRYYKVDDNYPYGVEKVVNKLNSRLHFEVCIINYYYLSRLFEYIKIPKKAIATHDCMAYKNLKIKESILCTTADAEAHAMQRCPHIFALQEMEANYFQLLSPQSKVYNLYGKYNYHSQPIVGNKNIVFLSGNNSFNQNGIIWFIRDVFPLIRNCFPESQLLVGGSICKVLQNIGDIEGVKTLGYIDNPAEFYALADVAINPIYQGTGLKIKTFEAIAFDKVTLVHPHSMTGIFRKEDAPLMTSDKPEEWVQFLTTIWNHPEYITEMKHKNMKYIEDMNKFIENEYKRFLETED